LTSPYPAPLSHYDLVLVEWLDHTEHSSEWNDDFTASHPPSTAFSVGWIYEETPETLVLIPHICYTDEDLSYSSPMTIVKGAIISRKSLDF
jgi:hypothetical protein